MTTTGDRIRAARLKRGMSAEELAKKVGYSTQSGIANLENRATGRGGYKLAQIAEVLGVSLGWLMSGDKIEEFEAKPALSEYEKQSISSTLHVKESAAMWCVNTWPFRHITPSQWQDLPLVERDIVERQICGLITSHNPDKRV